MDEDKSSGPLQKVEERVRYKNRAQEKERRQMNLGQLLQKVIPIQLEGKAAAGSGTSITDTTLPGTYDDDSFKGALLFVHSTTDGLAPQDEYSVILSYLDSSGAFSVDPAFSAVVGAGDYYAVADPQFKKESVLRVVNDCLRNFGIISLTDTSLTTAYNQLEYTLPLALKTFPLDRVEIGNTTYGFQDVQNWFVLPAAAGSAGKLVFESQPAYDTAVPSNCTLRIWYRDYHPAVDTYEDKISETIPDKRVIDECKLALQRWLIEKNSDYSEEALRKLGMLQQEQAVSKVEQRINVPNRKISRFLSIRDL